MKPVDNFLTLPTIPVTFPTIPVTFPTIPVTFGIQVIDL